MRRNDDLLTSLLGAVVKIDMGGYYLRGKLRSLRGDELHLEDRRGRRMMVSRYEARSVVPVD